MQATANAETEKEVRECVERHGVTPTVLFERLGHYDYGGGGFHCVHFTEEDTEIFLRRGLWVVGNAGSNAKLASGVAPIEDYRLRGMRIALGTDGPSSNNALDFFREMYLTSMLQKLKTGDASACPAPAVLEMATVGGARCMGLNDCDAIAPGQTEPCDQYDLDNSPDAHRAVPYYVAAQLALREDETAHAALSRQWQEMLLRLAPLPQPRRHLIGDVYGGMAP